MEGVPSREMAVRIAGAAQGVEGVRSALVSSSDGVVLGAAGSEDASREAALTSFVALRGEALPVHGDLRGMGRQLAGSKLSHVSIAGADGELLIYAIGRGTYLSARIASGRSVAASGQLADLAHRASNLPESTMRSS
jgi:predicted regulator of Ras-like GTPase activity (Roadblock/LC7/MglB family)